MKTRFARPLAATLRATTLALALGGCGGGTELLVVPLFVFGFDGSSGGTTVEVFFLPDQPKDATGNFDTVNVNFGATQTRYAGSWSGCDFSLTLQPEQAAPAAPGASSYQGRLQGTDQVVLTPPASSGRPTLTLKRKPTGTVAPFGC